MASYSNLVNIFISRQSSKMVLKVIIKGFFLKCLKKKGNGHFLSRSRDYSWCLGLGWCSLDINNTITSFCVFEHDSLVKTCVTPDQCDDVPVIFGPSSSVCQGRTSSLVSWFSPTARCRPCSLLLTWTPRSCHPPCCTLEVLDTFSFHFIKIQASQLGLVHVWQPLSGNLAHHTIIQNPALPQTNVS